METDKIFLGDSYIRIKGTKEEVSQFMDANQDGEVRFVLSSVNTYPPKKPL